MTVEFDFVDNVVFAPSVGLLMDMFGKKISEHFAAVLASAGITSKADDTSLTIWPERMGVFSRTLIEDHVSREEFTSQWPKILAGDNGDKTFEFPYFIFEDETLFLVEGLPDGGVDTEEFVSIGGGLYLSLVGHDYAGDGEQMFTKAVVIID